MYCESYQKLQERLVTMESERSPVISTHVVNLVRNPQPIPSTSLNWRDMYDPFSSNMLNPHIPGATTANPAVSIAHATQNVSLHSWGSFGQDEMDQPAARAQRSGMRQSVQDNTSIQSIHLEIGGSFRSYFVGGNPTPPRAPSLHPGATMAHLRPSDPLAQTIGM